MMTSAVYLDHNATTPLRPSARAAVEAALAHAGNPSSVHRAGRAARHIVEDARETVASTFGAPSAGVVFTGSGTEANALALTGSGRRRRLVSAVEHDSVLAAAADADVIPVDGDGVVDMAALERMLGAGGEAALVSVMAANNETGVIQPVAEIAALARRYGALAHCDAVQAAAHQALDMAALGLHMMTVSAHKVGGPMGAGALLLAGGADVAPLIRGGGQERGRRAGTENVAAIAGFAAAAKAARDELADTARLAELRDGLERQVRETAPEATVYGHGAARIGNTSCLGLPGMSNETQVMAFDLEGIAVSAGAACSSGKVGISHVLRAMGVDEEAARCAIRVSLGWTTTAADVARFVAVWRRLYDRSRAGRVSSAA